MSTICPLCESHASRPAFTKKGYDHFECSRCRAVFVEPRPSADEIAAFYRRHGADSISSVCWSEDDSSHRHWHDTWRHLLGEVERRSGRGPLLELGCGTGRFLAFAAQLGWGDLTGVEVVAEAAARARERVDAEIHVGDLTEASVRAGHFAVVFLWDILEHVGDLRKLLREVHGMLRPGGFLIIGTVNRHGWTLRLLKDRAMTVSPPEHLTFFTKAGLRDAFAATGFEMARCWSETIYLREWTRSANDTDYSRWRSSVTRSVVTRTAMRMANFLLGIGNLGDELIALARKRY